MSSIVSYTPKLYEVEDSDTINSSENERSALPESGSREGLAALEARFADLAASLRSKFAELERSFARATSNLARADAVRGPEVSSSPNAQSSRAADSSEPRVGVGKFGALIRSCAARNEVDPALVAAVVRQESGFQARAVSSAGALGLMQLMPDTARSLGVSDPFDPAQNIDGGTRLLRGLIDRYHGRLDFALAAYNAGPGAVDRFHGVPPYAETRAYVRDVLSAYHARALAS
ncbi:MAG: lytic transglycosylase domain-containing protein [Candidatus Eremiobacteraeota bacterium]|nr:lytic transglycosylase domain-containing protein [Candidatus Eremiobacteraeota bacterium]MBC5827030.1 lytic transglycosylase domain-containing protein [Candidatus Eremiobacteraeota bacterium]